MGFIPGMQVWYNCKSIDLTHHINKMNDKTYMTISIDAEKAFDKIQYPFIIKTLSKVVMEGTYLNIIQAIYDKPIASIYSMGKNYRISFKIGNKTGMPTFSSLIQHSAGSPSHSNQMKRRNKMYTNWKGRSKTVFIWR